MIDITEIENYKNLTSRQRLFVDAYLSADAVEMITRCKTFCNEFASYVFAYNKENELKNIIGIKYYTVDGYGNTKVLKDYRAGCKIDITVKNKVKYLTMNRQAKKIHRECMKAINDIRTATYSSEDKSTELELKDAIFNSSLYGEDSKDRNDNRKMMMKILGLDQIKIDTSIDIYQASGKQVLARLNKEIGNSDNEDMPVIPIDIDEEDDK